MTRYGCDLITNRKGSKSQIILNMVEEKLKEEYKKKIPAIIKSDKKLQALEADLIKTNNVYETKKKEFEAHLDKLNINWASKHEGCVIKSISYDVCYGCIVSPEARMELQEAENLFSLGRKKEAIAIWDKVISQYKLIG
jgi:phage terminase large subunit GpA-like protein